VRLSHRDGDRILNLLPDLYAHASPMQFFHTSIGLLEHLVGCDHCGWYAYEITDRVRLTIITAPDYHLNPRVISLMEEAMPSHPYLAHYAGHEATAVMLSDLPRQDRLAHRDQYEDVYRLADIHHEIILPLTMNAGSVVGVGLRRSLHDFTDRDRTVLDVLQPHLRRAYANAELVGEANEATLISTTAMQFDLTDREAQIAFWMAEGKTNWEISLILGMGVRTAEKHVEHVLAKLGVENRTTAAVRLRR
jgi:DNA-binding CsgD family transcriptional regulator